MEIEAIDSAKFKTRQQLLKQCRYYIKLFQISKKDLVPVSYSDLLLRK